MLTTPSAVKHSLEIDIFNVPFRPCRIPQEVIYEFYHDGKPRFEWDRLRQNWIFVRDDKIMEFCENCPMNIFQEVEGCKGSIEYLEPFLRAVAEVAPDSPLNELPLDGTPINTEENRTIRQSLEGLERLLRARLWPVAQVVRPEGPLREYFPDGGDRLLYYPWSGEGPPTLITVNEGYQIFLSQHGLIVKATYEDPVPTTFRRLIRQGKQVSGESIGGDLIGFQMSLARLPIWDPQDQNADGALEMTVYPADVVFRDQLDLIEVFTGLAVQAETGILVKPVE